jgi:SAM-dependent methyltransferase
MWTSTHTSSSNKSEPNKDRTPTFKDHFSAHASEYATFRPRYPRELFCYLAAIVDNRQLAWDCATGNGQAAVPLAEFFDRIVATDASTQQIANAEPHQKIEYRVASAESSQIASNSVDLITVAQALHWFDLTQFYAETKRVLRPRGVIAAWTYNLLHIAPPIDRIVNHYYHHVVGSFWPAERVLVEKFDELPFPFSTFAPPHLEMATSWSLDQLFGYLRTWSATQRFISANKSDPLESIERELRSAWGDPTQLHRVVWPLTLRVGRT